MAMLLLKIFCFIYIRLLLLFVCYHVRNSYSERCVPPSQSTICCPCLLSEYFLFRLLSNCVLELRTPFLALVVPCPAQFATLEEGDEFSLDEIEGFIVSHTPSACTSRYFSHVTKTSRWSPLVVIVAESTCVLLFFFPLHK